MCVGVVSTPSARWNVSPFELRTAETEPTRLNWILQRFVGDSHGKHQYAAKAVTVADVTVLGYAMESSSLVVTGT